MIPQTNRRCKPFLGKKRPGREKAHGVSSRPGVRTARPVQTPSGKLSAVVWAAGAGFMQGGGFVGSPAGAPPAAAGGRSPPEPAQRAPCGAWDAGALWWGRMVRGGARRAVGAGEMLGRGRGGCGGCGSGPHRGPPAGRAEAGRSPAAGAAGAGLRGHPASAERRMVIAGVVRRPPGHGRYRRWPAGFWCADGGHWGPCPAHRGPLPPHGRPSWKGS